MRSGPRQHRSARPLPRAGVRGCCCVLGGLRDSSRRPGPPPRLRALGPLVQFIDTDEHDDHADMSVQFCCTVHYIANAPVDHGGSTTITLRLGYGLRLSAQFRAAGVPSDQRRWHAGDRRAWTVVVPGEVTLELTWARELDFVMAPTASGLGLRVRLIGTRERRGGGVCNAAGCGGQLRRQSRVGAAAVRPRGSRGGRGEPCNPGLRVRNRHRGSALVPAAGRTLRERTEAERVLQIGAAGLSTGLACQQRRANRSDGGRARRGAIVRRRSTRSTRRSPDEAACADSCAMRAPALEPIISIPRRWIC